MRYVLHALCIAAPALCIVPLSRAEPVAVRLEGRMQRPPTTPLTKLKHALQEMRRHPLRTIVPPWSWKAAFCTAAMRALAFFASNLRAGRQQATKAMIVEAIFAVFAGGLIGAVSQYLRRAKPLWATALFLCFALPGVTTLAQAAVHHIARTPHQSGGLIISFCLASLAATFTWYAMRRGALLGGVDQTTVSHDLRALPSLTAGFVLAVPRQLFRGKQRHSSANLLQ